MPSTKNGSLMYFQIIIFNCSDVVLKNSFMVLGEVALDFDSTGSISEVRFSKTARVNLADHLSQILCLELELELLWSWSCISLPPIGINLVLTLFWPFPSLASPSFGFILVSVLVLVFTHSCHWWSRSSIIYTLYYS